MLVILAFIWVTYKSNKNKLSFTFHLNIFLVHRFGILADVSNKSWKQIYFVLQLLGDILHLLLIFLKDKFTEPKVQLVYKAILNY